MPQISIDQNNIDFTVKVKANEEYKPNEEIKALEERTNVIREKYYGIVKELQELLKDCKEWNEKNK